MNRRNPGGGATALAVALFLSSGLTYAGDSTNLGDGSAASSSYSTGVGYNASAQGTFSTAVGAETHATGYGSTTVGNQAFSTGKYSVSIGSYVNSDNTGISATSSGDESVAVGFYSKSAGKDSTALGARSNASSASGTALGHYANTTVDNGVALGSKSQASREAGVQGYVPEGTELTDEQKNSSTWKSTMAEASVGSEGNTRQVTHVAAGSEDTDAVNVAQLKAVDQKINSDVNGQIGQLQEQFGNQISAMSQAFDNRINEVEKETQAGIAMAIATAGLPQAYLPGKSMFAMSAGAYRGQSGYALGVSHVTNDGRWVLKVTGSGNSQGHFGGSVGAGLQW